MSTRGPAGEGGRRPPARAARLAGGWLLRRACLAAAAAALLSLAPGCAAQASQNPLQATYSGYDVVVVAGQSNSVGNSFTADAVNQPNDATSTLPVFYLLAGIWQTTVYPGWTGSTAAALDRAHEDTHKISCVQRVFPHGLLAAACHPSCARFSSLTRFPVNARCRRSTGAGGINEFSVSFVQQYIANGHLAPGRVRAHNSFPTHTIF